jgi:site-specific recombinase XerD
LVGSCLLRVVTFALVAEAGVDLSVIQALMGHEHVDSSAAYIHLAPSFLREEFDAACARLRARS